jgi:DNA polymerase-3 subunit beta
MKLVCNREKLWAAFQIAASVAPSRSPKEILTFIRMDANPDSVTLMATDMEVGIRVQVEGIEIEVPGKALLPVQRMASILRESSDEFIHIVTEDTGMMVKGNYSKFELPSANPDEFPPVVPFEESVYHVLPARMLKEMIRRTVFATDNESSRYALGGVLFEMGDEDITAVGTDGRRMARMVGKGTSVGGKSNSNNTIIPTRALTLLERAIHDKEESVDVATRANDVLVRTSRCIIYSRLVEGRFPNWRKVFPSREDILTIECTVGPFYAALRQASIVTDAESRGIEFHFGAGSLILTAKTSNIGQSRVEFPIAYDGKDINVTLDNRFVGDFLKVLEPECTFKIELGGEQEAVVFMTDDGYAYVVMPMSR